MAIVDFHASRSKWNHTEPVRPPVREVLLALLVALISATLLPAQSSQGTPVPTNTWVMAPTNGFPEQLVGYGKLVYASGIKKSVMLENYHQLSSEPNEAYLGYDFRANRWDVLNLGGNVHTESMPDAGHPVGMFTYDSSRNVFIHYCCFSGAMELEQPLHTWWFDPLGQVARDKHTAPKPGLSYMESTAEFDQARGIYVFWDSALGTWTYNPATNQYTQQNPGGTPPPSSMGTFPAMAYNTADRKMYLFGGGTNNLFTYDLSSNLWTKITPAGMLPSPRNSAAFAYDSANNIFLLFGGATEAGAVLNDTWIYDPAANTWTKLSPANTPPVPYFASWQYLTYDSDDNVFIMVLPGSGGYAGGQFGAYAAQTWFFRYRGTGPNAGTAIINATPSPGAVNRNSDAWANEPVLASSGSTLYLGWIETGRPFEQTDAAWAHLYVSQFNGASWVPLGGSFDSLNSEFGGFSESHAPSMTIANGTPWVSWYSANNTGSLPPNNLLVKRWNGSTWTGGAVGQGNPSSSYSAQGRSQIVNIAGAPYVAFLDNARDNYPWNNFLYVKKWNGTAWTLVGTGSLNKNPRSDGDIADSVAMATDGANPIVAWTEYVTNFSSDTNPQLYVAKWNGSAWNGLGGSVNVNTSHWAYDASLAYFNGQPYVAWVERSQSGPAQLFVKAWNGSAWNLVGSGTLNKDAVTGWAFRPNLFTDGTNLYLGWVEQQNLGQKPQVYVVKYAAGSWSPLGSSLNVDTANGGAERVSLAVWNGQPVAAWGEVKPGTLRQVYVKRWNGSGWTFLTGGGTVDTTAPTTPAGLIATVTSPSSVNLSWSASSDPDNTASELSYFVYRNGARVGTVSGGLTSYADSSLSPRTAYTYTISASDPAGNTSVQSAPAAVTTPAAADTTAPTTPTGLTATSTSSSQINLSWAPSSDPDDSPSQISYKVYRGGTQVGSTPAGVTTYADTGLSPSTTYVYRVAAFDPAGNTSSQSASATATTPAAGGSVNIIGMGKTTATCIDKDGDGYGVGPGCSGPDADDNDATVHTAADGIAKYGSLDAFLNHFGYFPSRKWFIAPNGNDTTCVPNDITKPCATFEPKVHQALAPGDIVFWRAGTYNNSGCPASSPICRTLYNLYPAASGTSGKPIIFMAYPGEKAVLDDPTSVEVCNGETLPEHDIIIDGLVLDNSLSTHLGQAVDGCALQNFVIRNVEAKNHDRGIFIMQNNKNLLIENNVIHDSPNSHTIYLGARDLPSSNITVRNNILYRAGLTTFQHNGRVTNLVVDNNYMYAFDVAGISLEMGVSNSFIRNNVVFGGNGSPLVIYDYDSPVNIEPTIAPYDQNYNLIENNTLVVATKQWEDGTPLSSSYPNIAIRLATVNQQQDLGHNTFRNNIFWNPYPDVRQISFYTESTNYDGNYSFNGSDPRLIINTTTFDHNLVYPAVGSAVMFATNVAGPIGTPPPNVPPPITVNYSWSQFSNYGPLVTANINGNPAFVRNSPDTDATNPALFNFGLLPGSAAIGSGTPVGAPATDLSGKIRPSSPSIGAYEYQGVTAGSACDLNGDGVVDNLDVQIAINQALGIASCTSADLQQNGRCDVIDVQRIINASLGRPCMVGP